MRSFLSFVLFLTVGFACMAEAHPHVFADVTIKAVFSQDGFTGVLNHWVYDEIYSAAMLASADTDGDGNITVEEGDRLQSMILADVAKSNYFNYILSGSEFLEAKPVKTAKVSVEGKRLVLDFMVGFSAPVSADYAMLVIVVSDPSNYVKLTTDMENEYTEESNLGTVSAPESIDVEYFADGLDGLTLFKAFLPDVEGLYLRYKKK